MFFFQLKTIEIYFKVVFLMVSLTRSQTLITSYAEKNFNPIIQYFFMNLSLKYFPEHINNERIFFFFQSWPHFTPDLSSGLLVCVSPYNMFSGCQWLYNLGRTLSHVCKSRPHIQMFQSFNYLFIHLFSTIHSFTCRLFSQPRALDNRKVNFLILP